MNVDVYAIESWLTLCEAAKRIIWWNVVLSDGYILFGAERRNYEILNSGFWQRSDDIIVNED